MHGSELIDEARACGFTLEGGILKRGAAKNAVVLFVGQPGVDDDDEPNWQVREVDAPHGEHAWAEMARCGGTRDATFFLRDRASWWVWGAGRSSQLGDRAFARRFCLKGPPTPETIAPFSDAVRRALLRAPRYADFKLFGSMKAGGHVALTANWGLARAPRGLVAPAADALDLLALHS